MFKKILTALLIITILPVTSFAGNVAYKNNGSIVISEDVFNELATESKLLEVYKAESEVLKTTINDLKTLNEQQKQAYENKINNMQMQLDAKDSVIALYKDNENKYKELELLYNNDRKTIKKMKRMNVLEKIAVVGLTTFAAIKAEDCGSKVAIGAAGTAITLIDW